jgi:PAS domain S-box-containing protein
LFEFHAWLIFPPLVFFPLSITYAILRHRLLEVDALLVRAVTYAMVTAIVFTAFYGLLAFLSLLLGSRVATSNPLVIAAYLFLLVVGLNPLRSLVQTFIDRLFYRSPADYRHALSLLSRALVATPSLSQALNLLEEQLQQSLAPEKFILHLYNDELGEYVPHATRETSAPSYAVNHPLVELIASSTTPLRLPLSDEPAEVFTSVNQDLEKLNGFIFVPLRYKRRMIGFMSLGPRRSGEPYNDNDLDFLVAVANQSTLALENARLFENLRRTLDQTLEMKNLMDDIFSSVATGIITTDLKKNITLFNRAAENILGVPGNNVMGKPLSYALPGVSAELDPETTNAQQNVVSLINPPPSRLTERKNLYLRLSLSPLRDARLNTKGTAIVFEDLTERRELEAERERIRQTFGRVVSPRIRDRLLADVGNLELNGKKQTVTILFADLSGFSSFSEKHEPETVFSTLNAYLSIAAQAILEEEGTLDKFMGDAVLAIWNSPDEQPDHALRAVRAGREIIRRSQQAHAAFSNPEQRLEFRVGVTTGEAIIGNVGTNELFNYTAIGDVVNLAQRLQAAAEKGEIMVEKSVYNLISACVKVRTQKNIAVKGREKTVQAYIIEDISA